MWEPNFWSLVEASREGRPGEGRDIRFHVDELVLPSFPTYPEVMVLVPGRTRELLNMEESGARRAKAGGMDWCTERPWLYAALKQWQLSLCTHCSKPCSLAVASFQSPAWKLNRLRHPTRFCMNRAGFWVVKNSSPLSIFWSARYCKFRKGS